MDSFDKRIEEYKRELMKYAKKNGTIYTANNEGFREETDTVPEAEPADKKIYNLQYMNNRPMPDEYPGDGGPDYALPTNTDPRRRTEGTSSEADTYKDYDEFIAANTQFGKLRVQAYAASRVFPIQNAHVTVEKEFENGTHAFGEEYTDISGVAEGIILPTKSKALSMTPNSLIPYSTYTVKVTHPQFTPITFHNVPIFEAIESLQPAAMIPQNNTPVGADVFEEEPKL